jgi:hypothetical protein
MKRKPAITSRHYSAVLFGAHGDLKVGREFETQTRVGGFFGSSGRTMGAVSAATLGG